MRPQPTDNVTQAIVTEGAPASCGALPRGRRPLHAVIDAVRIYVVKQDGQSHIPQSGEYHQLLAEPGPFRN